MSERLGYLIVPLLSTLLITAQALWGSFIKSDKPLHGSLPQIAERFLTSPKVWLGGILYVGATVLYFVMLSRYRFFSIQIAMTGLAILFSTVLSIVLFNEKVTVLNMVGMFAVLTGVVLVFTK